jgi:hypothetical protein
MPKDPANNDPFTQGGEHGFIGKAVVQYNIVFDDEKQLKNFYRFIKGLKVVYPEVRTIGGRIDRYLTENVIDTPEWNAHLEKLPSAGKTKDIDKPTTA